MTRKFDIQLFKTNLKQGTDIHQPMAWPVPHACAQPYHPGSGQPQPQVAPSPRKSCLKILKKLPEVYKKFLKSGSLSKIKMTGMTAIFSVVQLTRGCREIVLDNYHQIVTIKKTMKLGVKQCINPQPVSQVYLNRSVEFHTEKMNRGK